MNLFDNNWKEKVASMTEADDHDIEKAFSDMANGFVTNRVGDLMKDEHRIGFEIVKKNDDNTRMLGIFAFKVDKDLIFAPVFFLSGEIKGPLLYRCDNKRFVPANKDWAAYLIEHMNEPQGRGIHRSKAMQSESRVNMDRLLSHPTKEASIKAAATEEFGEDIYYGIGKAIIKQADSHILKEFLQEHDTGLKAAELIEKAASMENSDEFVLRLAQCYGDPSNFMPDKFTYTEKQAAAQEEARRLELVYEFDKSAAAKADQYFKDGFYLFDNRYLEDTCKCYVQDDALDGLESVTDAGKYDILGEDGNLITDCVCFHYSDDNTKRTNYSTKQHKRENLLVIKDGKFKLIESALGVKRTEGAKCRDLGGDTTVNEGSLYVAYVECADSIAGIYHIIDKKSVDGIQYCKAYRLGRWDVLDNKYYNYKYMHSKDLVKSDPHSKFIINKDLEQSDLEKGVFGKDARFIRINTKKSEYDTTEISVVDNLENSHKHDVWVYDKFNLPTLSITFNKSASYPYQIHDTIEKQSSIGLDRKEILIKLASDLMLPAEDAYMLTEKAEQSGKVDFLYDGIDKLAARIRIIGRPEWKEEISETGLQQGNDQRFVLRIAGDQNTHEVPHIGDALNPTTSTGLPNLTVVSTDPAQLRDLADTYRLPNVFEHGVVGTLADTFDANRMLDKYLPKLHEALDAIGRTLFLFYWKPDDFERQYGQDDMNNLEAQLESEFESFGALTLNLAKKTDKQKAVVEEPGDIGI